MLCKFVSEARQGNCKPYTPKTMLKLLTNLQSNAFSKNSSACYFKNHRDARFQPLHNNTSKELLNECVGAPKERGKESSPAEEEHQSKRVLSKGLLNSIFYCGFVSEGVRNTETLREARDPSDGSKMMKCVIYTKFGSKV